MARKIDQSPSPRSVAEARDSAKVEDQVRLLARAWKKCGVGNSECGVQLLFRIPNSAFRTVLTLEPDGQATACKAVQAGSTPAGVFDHSTASPNYVLNIGGFSDAVFDVVAAFLRNDAERFVSEIEAIEL